MELVFVRVRDCACPDSPHDADGVYLKPTLSLAGGLAGEQAIAQALTETAAAGELSGLTDDASQERDTEKVSKRLTPLLLEVFVRHGYDHADGEGLSLEDILADYTLSQPVAEKGDELYGEAVMSPLAARLQVPVSPRPNRRSRRGSTSSSTSPRPTPIRKPSRPSSPPASVGSESFTA